jgi:thioredoxin reductase (NADPH)
MKTFHLIICLTLTALLIWLNRTFVLDGAATFGGLSWYGWVSIALVIFFVGLLALLNDSARAFGFFKADRNTAAEIPDIRVLQPAELAELRISKYRGPEYPHPVIFTERCIGCQACVDACPHDVLAIVDGYAVAVAPDLCMEDTACQAECPVNPKACIVINTTKPIVSRPSPTRDGATYQTNIPCCYIIGDVSGVPLIKNAVKEGAEVIEHIAADLKTAPAEAKAEYDVAIIGIGPGGASAAASAQKLGLRYVAIEQDQTLASIENYPKGKYIYFKPDTKDWEGGLPDLGPGNQREKILEAWNNRLNGNGVKINEHESCKAVNRSDDGDYFVVKTERMADKSQHVYNARRVVLAIGLRGAPNKLRLPNEDMLIRVEGRDEPKVLYSLSNPADYRGRRIVVVGGGNVAVEATVDLVAKRNGNDIIPRSANEMNHVTLLVRDYLAPTVKFGNKVQLYQCFDDGTLDLRFGVGIKEMRWNELVLEDVVTGKIVETVSNDYVFALIGGERPDRFLESIGIKIA